MMSPKIRPHRLDRKATARSNYQAMYPNNARALHARDSPRLAAESHHVVVPCRVGRCSVVAFRHMLNGDIRSNLPSDVTRPPRKRDTRFIVTGSQPLDGVISYRQHSSGNGSSALTRLAELITYGLTGQIAPVIFGRMEPQGFVMPSEKISHSSLFILESLTYGPKRTGKAVSTK